jgi:hypothetical protein
MNHVGTRKRSGGAHPLVSLAAGRALVHYAQSVVRAAASLLQPVVTGDLMPRLPVRKSVHGRLQSPQPTIDVINRAGEDVGCATRLLCEFVRRIPIGVPDATKFRRQITSTTAIHDHPDDNKRHHQRGNTLGVPHCVGPQCYGGQAMRCSRNEREDNRRRETRESYHSNDSVLAVFCSHTQDCIRPCSTRPPASIFAVKPDPVRDPANRVGDGLKGSETEQAKALPTPQKV